MTQDEIIEIANKASKEWLKELPSPEETANPIPKRFLEIFAKLVAAKAIAELESQEPVAWVHNFIEGGISIGKRPSDLDRHPDRWTALYKDPKPCPTCEALCRTVMLDQTSHDTHPPQRTEQNFCPRCGKRTPDLITIHTCTPPKEKNNA
jgi:hypothetical protein